MATLLATKAARAVQVSAHTAAGRRPVAASSLPKAAASGLPKAAGAGVPGAAKAKAGRKPAASIMAEAEAAATHAMDLAEAVNWTPVLFGQGHKNGGSKEHIRNRYQMFCMMRDKSALGGHALDAVHAKNWEDILAQWDRDEMARMPLLAGYGSFVYDFYKKLRLDMVKDPAAFVKWLKTIARFQGG
jgi:hypothetical protein